MNNKANEKCRITKNAFGTCAFKSSTGIPVYYKTDSFET
jgi:hypothetical protein